MPSFYGFVAMMMTTVVFQSSDIVGQALDMPGFGHPAEDPSVEGHILYLNNATVREQVDAETPTGVSNSGDQGAERIVNGASASSGEYTYFCRNIMRSSFFGRLSYNCGCSYIADGWVLTAAHCVTDDNTGQLLSGAYGATLGYYCGSQNNCCNPSVSTCPNFETIQGNYIVHPNYNVQSGLFDLALLKLDRLPVRFPFEKVLPDDGFVTDSLLGNSVVTAIGAGQNSNSGTPAGGVLQELDMLYWPPTSCANRYGRSSFGGAAVCAYVSQGLGGVCFGDSGGPLIVRDVQLESGERRDVQIGVHSFISGTCENKQRPDVMASVAGGMSFIRQNVCSSNIGETRPYWCDAPVEAGTTQQQDDPEENEDEAEPDGAPPTASPIRSPTASPVASPPTGCTADAIGARFLFNPITGKRKGCGTLGKKGQEQLFCESPLSDAKQACCATCAGFTQRTG